MIKKRGGFLLTGHISIQFSPRMNIGERKIILARSEDFLLLL
jgi:hypothetical protein